MDAWENELSELVRTRQRALLGYAYLLCGDTRQSEDLVQDALVKTFSRRSTPERGRAEPYVRQAILTIYLDQYRRRRRWLAVRHLVHEPEPQASPEARASASADVSAALKELSPRQRACIVLRYFEDLTVPAIATRLGCAEGTAKRHLSDALARMENVLDANDPARSAEQARFAPGGQPQTPASTIKPDTRSAL